MVMLADGLLPGHRMCPSTTVACSVMEEKIDLLNDSVSRGLQNREDSAQQIKRCCWVKRFAESPYFMHISHFLLVLGAVSWKKRLTYLQK